MVNSTSTEMIPPPTIPNSSTRTNGISASQKALSPIIDPIIIISPCAK